MDPRRRSASAQLRRERERQQVDAAQGKGAYVRACLGSAEDQIQQSHADACTPFEHAIVDAVHNLHDVVEAMAAEAGYL